MPDWHGLLRKLLEEAWKTVGSDSIRGSIVEKCARATNSGDFRLAASLIRKVLSDAEVVKAVTEQFDNSILERASKPQQQRMRFRMEQLVRGPWAGIITTNYDRLIETAIDQSGRKMERCVGADRRLGILLALPHDESFFLKIHGSITGSDVVLSTEDYDELYLKTSKIGSFLKALMLRYYPVFIGCSLEDEVVRMRRQLLADFDGMIPQGYALLPASQRNTDRREWLADVARIDSMLYPDSDRSHASVDSFLQATGDLV